MAGRGQQKLEGAWSRAKLGLDRLSIKPADLADAALPSDRALAAPPHAASSAVAVGEQLPGGPRLVLLAFEGIQSAGGAKRDRPAR
mmetsp:Transcript_30005/g.69850  ORF Transcript_30005/g.69850 Transcript_30005/m.69850 type:complete len:86 (-) Transcript_30005:3493-3750(-)